MKKKLLSVTVVAICLAILGYGTAAYVTDGVRAHNVITSGGIGIELVEKTVENGAEVDFPRDGISGVMPGTEVSKIVTVKNTDSGDAWLRAKVESTIRSAAQQELPKTIAVGQTSVDVLTLDFNIAVAEGGYWIDGGDGFYYYSVPVRAAESTSALFRTVSFAKEMGNEYQNCKVFIDVTAQAVQSANNPIPDGGSVTDIKGWPTI